MIKKRDPKRSLRILSEYAYYIMDRKHSIYLSRDRSTVLLYYRKSEYRLSLPERFRYVLAFVKAVRLNHLLPALKRERLVEGLRKPYDDYIYVWALATEPGHRGLSALADIRDHLFGQSAEWNVPILIETTVKRMLGFYRYVGFEEYHHWHDAKDHIDVWFLERKVRSS